MLAQAVTVIGLSRDDFEWMLPIEYEHCVKAWAENRESEIRLQYELQRFNAWLVLPLKNNVTQNDLCPFEWEKKKLAKVKEWHKDQLNTKN